MAPVAPPPILWDGGDLAPVTDELVPLLEEIQHDKKLAKLRKAKIDPALIKEIEKDLAWPDRSKKLLANSGAALGAKWLNKAGLSAAYKDEVNFGVALMVILRCEAAINRRLDKLISAAEKAAAAAEGKKSSETTVTAARPAEKTLNLTDALKTPEAVPEKK